jgi:hypothetical protein
VKETSDQRPFSGVRARCHAAISEDYRGCSGESFVITNREHSIRANLHLSLVPRQNCDLPLNQSNRTVSVSPSIPCQTGSMLRLLRLLFVLTVRSLYSRRDLLLENLALRQQLAVLRKRHPRARFSDSDRLFWAALLRLWSKWKRALALVQPETVVRWHRAGFKLYGNGYRGIALARVEGA